MIARLIICNINAEGRQHTMPRKEKEGGGGGGGGGEEKKEEKRRRRKANTEISVYTE